MINTVQTFWNRIVQATNTVLGSWRNTQLTEDVSILPGFNTSLDVLDQARLERYQLLWRYYNGEHRKHLKRRITPTGIGPDDNIVINLSRRIVDKGVNFLFSKPINWQLNEANQTENETLLAAIWGNPESQMAFCVDLATNGGVTGDAYIQIVPPNDFNPLPSLVNLNPSLVYPRTNPNNFNDEWAFEIRFMNSDILSRTIHAKAEDGQSWLIWTEQLSKGKWVQIGETILWPFTWSLIVHTKNLPNPNSYFGKSDLEDADLNDAINMVASNINRITRIFANPIVWGRGFGKDAATSVDLSQMMLSSDANAQMGALELGRNISGSQEFLKFLRTMFAEITGVPEADPDRMNIGAQSGFALKVLFNDLILKTNVKRSLYGKAIIEVNRRLLDLMDKGSTNICTLHWSDSLPVDERAITDSDKFDLEAELASKETISTKRGYDWKVELERKQAEKASDGTVGEMLLRAFETGGQA